MRRVLAAVTVASLEMAPNATVDAAIPVTCTLCATAKQQIIEYALQGKEYALQMKEYVEAANTYIKAVENTVSLPFDAINQVSSVYYRGTGLVRRTNALLSSDAPIMRRVAAARGLGSSVGRYPEGTLDNAEWWAKRVEEQWEDNKELLGIEEERQQLNTELLEFAASNGNLATGQMQMLQANHHVTLAMGQQLQSIHNNLTQQFAYQMEKDADKALKEKAYNDFLKGLEGLTVNTGW